MRNFIMDIWVWNKGKHSRPLKSIRFQLDHFPTDEECEREVNKDKDVIFYKDREYEISYNNIHEYQE